MIEPGLDKHLWESWWQQFDEDLQDSPAEALSELDRLIAQMMEARDYALGDPVARAGKEREIVADYLGAHEITRAVESGAAVDQEDIDTAIENYRAIYDYLIVERATP